MVRRSARLAKKKRVDYDEDALWRRAVKKAAKEDKRVDVERTESITRRRRVPGRIPGQGPAGDWEAEGPYWGQFLGKGHDRHELCCGPARTVSRDRGASSYGSTLATARSSKPPPPFVVKESFRRGRSASKSILVLRRAGYTFRDCRWRGSKRRGTP